MKLEDRILQPFLNQIRGVSAKEVNDVLLASNRPLVYWGRWIRRHPDIKTLDALRHAVQNDQDQRQAAPGGGRSCAFANAACQNIADGR